MIYTGLSIPDHDCRTHHRTRSAFARFLDLRVSNSIHVDFHNKANADSLISVLCLWTFAKMSSENVAAISAFIEGAPPGEVSTTSCPELQHILTYLPAHRRNQRYGAPFSSSMQINSNFDAHEDMQT